MLKNVIILSSELNKYPSVPENLKFKDLTFYQQLRKDPNIIIAKMDATANDVPSPYEVRG